MQDGNPTEVERHTDRTEQRRSNDPLAVQRHESTTQTRPARREVVCCRESLEEAQVTPERETLRTQD